MFHCVCVRACVSVWTGLLYFIFNKMKTLTWPLTRKSLVLYPLRVCYITLILEMSGKTELHRLHWWAAAATNVKATMRQGSALNQGDYA